MVATALYVLAQGNSNTQEAPDGGVGAALIIGTILAIILAFSLIYLVVSKRAKASKGGVEPVPGSRQRGEPPFESIERDR
jgi:hypothetical protein